MKKWTDWIKEFPKLEQAWKNIPEPHRTWFAGQIDVFAKEQEILSKYKKIKK